MSNLLVREKIGYSNIYKLSGYLFILPALFLFCVFVIYPAISSLYLSFRIISPFGDRSIFIGLKNYINLFQSNNYINSLKVTGIFVLYTVIIGLPFSLLISMFLNLPLKGISGFRTIFFLPLAISPVMAGVIWIFLLNPNIGLLNHLLSVIGLVGPSWRTDPNWALPTVIIVTIWKQLGFNIIIFLAALQNVPLELYEAASIDGANSWRKFVKITIPLISPTILFLTITSVIQSFESFGAIDVLTSGGPANTTNVLVYALYKDAFVNFRTGYASAQAYIIFMILLLISVFQFKFMNKKVHYQ
ncbi:MAG: sugar ABC transporter permease [Methanolobus sp.]|nr:sugar ABC transporter permease [Methanolobus sp.]